MEKTLAASKKHLFIKKEIHARLKDEAKKEGKMLSHFVNHILEWALDYKKFLDKK